MPEPQQYLRGNAVSRRHRLVGERLRPMNQRLVIVGREKEATVRILESVEQDVHELADECHMRRVPAVSQKLYKSGREKRVVVEIRGESRAPILEAREQPSVLPHLSAHEVGCAACGVREIVPVQHACRHGHALDHQSVPGRQNLLVASGPDSRIAAREQFLARGVQYLPGPTRGAPAREILDRDRRV